MTAQSDYQHVLDVFSRQHLPAYVSYVDAVSIRGIPDQGDSHGPNRVTVDTRAKKIVEGKPGHLSISGKESGQTNPVTNPAFDPACYRAASDSRVTYEGKAAIRFALESTCGPREDYFFSELYADATTFVPLAANGTVDARESLGGARADVQQRYGIFGGYIMPTLLTASVRGSGLVFWLHVRAEESYTSYDFENTRRQSH